MDSRPGEPFASLLAKFEADFPFGTEVLTLFRAANAKPIWLSQVRQGAPPRSWAVHVRLPRMLEEHFGMTRQFLAYCAGSDDLRPREATRIQSLIRGAEDPIEPYFAMLATQDPLAEEKIRDWAVEREIGVTIVPITQEALTEVLEDGQEALALRKVIEKWISAHDLYDERDPVTGERFYGRAGALRDLERKLAQRRGHVGIFGLRRIGKTSLILELSQRLAKRPAVIPIFVDLEGTEDAAHATYRLGEELADTLADQSSLSDREARKALHLPEQMDDVEPRRLISRVMDSLRSVLKRGALKEQHLILMLDEIEALLPSASSPAAMAVDFFRGLRAISQETQRMSLVVAGVNATPTESPVLGDQDNPLFGLLSIEYLGPLETGECDEMIRTVGRRMQVRWDGPAVSALTGYVGAHPLLARLAASDVVNEFSERPLRPTIKQAEDVLGDFHVRRSPIFEQMVQSLRKYYADEFEVLRLIATGDQGFATELLDADPTLVNHLVGYGVLKESTLSIPNAAFRRWLRLSDG
jgi:hypothetical protein